MRITGNEIEGEDPNAVKLSRSLSGVEAILLASAPGLGSAQPAVYFAKRRLT